MRLLAMFVILALATFRTLAGTNDEILEHFDWPTEQPSAIPDLRLNSIIAQARHQSRAARSMARDARRMAGQAERREAVRQAIGLGDKPALIDSETVITASDAPGIGSLGIIRYPSGASMLGALRPNGTGLGIYTPDDTSALEQFRGEIFNANWSTPRLDVGIYYFKNGEEFSGSYSYDGAYGTGVYSSSDRSKRFVGVIDFSGIPWIPVRGILTSRNGKLLAVIGPE